MSSLVSSKCKLKSDMEIKTQIKMTNELTRWRASIKYVEIGGGHGEVYKAK